MKKLLLVLISLLLALTFSACGLFEPETEAGSLEFTRSFDGLFSKSYIVSGIGECTDTDIVIPSEYKGLPVVAIGHDAFEDCTNITSVTIPDSVKTIRSYAFKNCTALESITIPDSVTEIDSGAFENCSSLESIKLPNSITEINYWVFKGCSSLKSVTIPGSVTRIGSWAFDNCSSLQNITLPDGLKTIENGAFEYCTSLESIVLPDSITSMEKWIFDNCTSLTSVTLPKGISSIPDSMFRDCTNLVSIMIPDGVTSVGESVFYSCNNLTNITIPQSVTNIGEDAFSWCYSLSLIYNNSNLNLEFGSEDNGGIAKYAKVIVDKENVRYIDDNHTLTDDGFLFLEDDSECKLIAYCGAEETVTLPEYFNGNSYEFSGVKGLIHVIIPNNVEKIDRYAFCSTDVGGLYETTSLKSITIPASVTEISESAFYKCFNLTSIIVDKNNETFSSIDGNLYTKDGTTLIQYANGKKDTEFTIPGGVTNINAYTFKDCSGIVSFNVDESNDYYQAINGNIYTKDGKVLVLYANGKADTLFIVPSGVTNIAGYVFAYNKTITKVIIPNSVTTIDERAFCFCENLTEVNFLDNSPLTYIGDYAFDYCKNLTSINIPNSVTVIGERAFSSCSSLTDINIPNSVTVIGESAFSSCSGLTEINIPSSITDIGKHAFSGCTGLTKIEIPNGVTKISMCAFSGCSGITEIKIPDSVTAIESDAFNHCSSLTSVVIPDSVVSINNSAFSECDNIKAVYYCGSSYDWDDITIGSYNSDLTFATRYYYSETKPTSTGNFWHYVDGEIVVW